MRGIRTAAAITIAAVITGACTGTSESKSETSEAARAPSGMGAYYGQKITWRECGEGFDCGTVDVPLDYANPGGPKLQIAVNRLPATGKRKGSLVTNPGGPGGSGVEFVRQAGRSFGPGVRKSFDVVGFDPRGVGKSDPVRCLDTKALDAYLATDTSPDGQRDIADLTKVGQGFAGGCQTKSARLLPRVGTVYAARDIDIVRAALGDEALTYFGASYGTYLGAYYAEQFPQKVRALVLDGAVDPALSAEALNIEQAKGFETALRAFAADCVKSGKCPLGSGSVGSAVRKISRLQDRAERKPLKNTSRDGRQATESLVVFGIAAALYNKETWPVLNRALREAIGSGDGTTLLKLADSLVERKPDGTYTNQTESNMAVNCVDKPYPRDTASFEKLAAQSSKVAPRFGPFVMWGSLPCAYWPAPPVEQPRALTARGAKPIVVVGTTRDPATPYKWAQKLASQLESGVLLSFDGDGHTAYLQGNPCISAAVDRYIVDAKPPARNTVCR